MAFIQDVQSLKKALVRLCALEDTLLFRTPKDVLMMIRTATDGGKPEELNFDISIVTESEPRHMTTCMKNESEAVPSEAGDFYIIEEYMCMPDDLDTIESARQKLNEMYTWSVCPCSSYMIKDGQALCYMCDMTYTSETSTEFCVICHEHGHERWTLTTTCCKQKMHKMCYSLWENKSETCAYCRTPHPV